MLINLYKKTIIVHGLMGSFQTYEMGLPSRQFWKSIALKSVEELKSLNLHESEIEKEVSYLAKKF